MAKYSIIIPCYDATEEDFRRCLDSIKTQTLQPHEVICVDDASPVKTPQIAKEYGCKYIRHEINLNNGGARNTGIKEATGDYLVFINSDDYILPETLEEIDKVNKGQDLIVIGFKTWGKYNYGCVPKDPYLSKLGWYGEPMHIVRRQFLLDNNIWEQEHVSCADVQFTLLIEKHMKSWAVVPKALYMYQTGHDTSTLVKISKGIIKADDPKTLGLEKKKKVLFHFPRLWLGGTEMSMLNLIKKIHKDYDVIISFTGEKNDVDVMIEFSKYGDVIKTYKDIECDTAVFCSFYQSQQDQRIKAKKYIEWCHATIKDIGFNQSIKKREGMYKFVAVSEETKKQMIECGYDKDKIEIIHNELNPDIEELAKEKIDFKKATLNLVTVSRISEEKGFHRVVKLAKLLKENKIDFVWYIVGDDNNEYANKVKKDLEGISEVFFVGKKYNPYSYIKNSDALVQLSNRESYCLSIAEARYFGKPIICTNFNSHAEQVIDGVNGIVLDMNLSNVDINKIKSIKKLKSSYNQKDEWKKWLELL